MVLLTKKQNKKELFLYIVMRIFLLLVGTFSVHFALAIKSWSEEALCLLGQLVTYYSYTYFIGSTGPKIYFLRC